MGVGRAGTDGAGGGEVGAGAGVGGSGVADGAGGVTAGGTGGREQPENAPSKATSNQAENRERMAAEFGRAQPQSCLGNTSSPYSRPVIPPRPDTRSPGNALTLL